VRKSVFILCLFILIYGCSRDQKNRQFQETQLQQDTVSGVDVFGIVKPEKVKHISLDFDCAVLRVNVRTGDVVSAGDVLVTLDLSIIYSIIRAREHALGITRLELARLGEEYAMNNKQKDSEYRSIKNSLSIVKKELIKLENEYAEKKGLFTEKTDPDVRKLFNDIKVNGQELENAVAEFENMKELLKANAVTETEVIEYKILVEQKKAGLKDSELSLEKIMLQKSRELTQLDLEINQKKADLNQLTIKLENIRTPEIISMEIKEKEVVHLENDVKDIKNKLERPFLQNNTIVCPVSIGVIEEIHCTEGDYKNSHSLIMKIVDLDSLVVEANVPEEFLKEVRLAGRAEIVPLADPEKKYSGEVMKIAGIAVRKDAETVVPVILSIRNNDGFLLPYFNVDVRLFKE